MGVNLLQLPDNALAMISDLNSKEIARFRSEQGFDPGVKNFVRLFDDFTGDVIADQWSAAQGSDGQGAIAAVVASSIGGVVRLTSGDAGSGTAADASILTHGLNWRASNGGLYLRVRAALESAANVCVNIGFTDVLATTTLEMPVTISGTTLTTATANGVVFVYDTAQTNDFWHMQGVKADTDTAINNSSVLPVAATYNTYEIFINDSGAASFYIDEIFKGAVANAVTTSTALTPVIGIETRTTTTKYIDIDYIEVAMMR